MISNIDNVKPYQLLPHYIDNCDQAVVKVRDKVFNETISHLSLNETYELLRKQKHELDRKDHELDRKDQEGER